jgi:hypothetical protein
MLEFSRDLYRELAGDVDAGAHLETAQAKLHVLRAAEACMERLASDRQYFARPARSLFLEIRWCFPMTAQAKVFETVRRVIAAAEKHLDEVAPFGEQADGTPLRCPAYTRQGTPCRRAPLPGGRHCPSHRHLELEQQHESVAA